MVFVFTISGSILAFILGIDKYINDQVRLRIDIKDAYFVTRPPNSLRPQSTMLDIVVDIRNEGRQPTTISGVDLSSNITDLNNVSLSNTINHYSSGISRSSFEPIRVDADYRIEKDLFVVEGIYLESCNEFDCTLNFKTAHKTITKRLTVNWKE